jgi:hypothetical protein
MGIFRRKVPPHLIPVHPDNAVKNDWVVLLEAGTIVGPSPEKLRVARSTLERKVVKKYNILLRAQHFLVVDGYDPRIHALYFCPQLYRYDPDLGRRPWYEPLEKLPEQPIISTAAQTEFDTVVVEMPAPRGPAVVGS